MTEDRGRLVIPNLKVEDAGTYICDMVSVLSSFLPQPATAELLVLPGNFITSRFLVHMYRGDCMSVHVISNI